MFINWKTRELNLNIVYYGPALSGKTTNLEKIHARLKPEVRSELFTLNTHEDRTIFFDFLQLTIGELYGLRPKFGLYTVPGQVYYTATRETVLTRADAIVFVVDSQAARLEDNRDSWRDMRVQLQRLNRSLETTPLVIQLNKRDLPSALPIATLQAELGLDAWPCIEAAAVRGQGVQETLHAIIHAELADVQRKLAVARVASGAPA